MNVLANKASAIRAAVIKATMPGGSGTDWFDRASDRFNPILVKEVRQALKSRAFVTTFFLLLLGSWMISAIGLLAAGAAIEYGRLGQYFFLLYFGILCVALGVVVPFHAFRSLLGERDENTYELLSITALSPGQIVRGKWLCALVQALLFYATIIPFIAFSSLLQGFDLVQAILLLAAALYGSIGMSITTLMLSTTVKHRTWQGLVSMLVMALLGGAISLVLSGLTGLAMVPLPIDEPVFWWGIAIGAAISLSYMWLFYQIAAARLTFASENRATAIRLTTFGQLLMIIAIAAIVAWSNEFRFDRELFLVAIVAASVHLAIVGLSVAPEIDGLSRRTRRGLPKWLIGRALLAPLLPGGSLGYLYLLICLAVFFACCCWGWASLPAAAGTGPLSLNGIAYSLMAGGEDAWQSIERRSELLVGLAVCCYIAIYSGMAGLMVRIGRRITTIFEPVHARTIVVILVAGGVIIPMSLRVGRFVPFGQTSIFDVCFPFWFLAEIMTLSSLPWQHGLVLSVAAVVVASNVPAMLKAVREALASPPPSASRPILLTPAKNGQLAGNGQLPPTERT